MVYPPNIAYRHRSISVIVALMSNLRNPITTNITCYCVWYQHQHQPRCHRQYPIQNMALSGHTTAHTSPGSFSNLQFANIYLHAYIYLTGPFAVVDIIPYAEGSSTLLSFLRSLSLQMSWCLEWCHMLYHDIMPLCHLGLFHLQVHERMCRSDGLWTIKI